MMNVAQVMQTVAGLLNVQSKLEADTVSYFGVDFVYSNEKLKKTGYQFVYPDARDGLRDTLLWYRREGWI